MHQVQGSLEIALLKRLRVVPKTQQIDISFAMHQLPVALQQLNDIDVELLVVFLFAFERGQQV
jgi:hypothetical protein